VMGTHCTEADFERLSWHDCHIWRLELRTGDPDQNDWTSDLAIDLDFITECLCGTDGCCEYRVAPATLVFHGVTDLRIKIDWGESGFRMSLHEASIDGIDRELVRDQKVYLDRPYWSWRIRLNWPAGGEIAFGAVGFSQTLRAEPVLSRRECLSFHERSRLLGR
jgi:hypothetical protein